MYKINYNIDYLIKKNIYLVFLFINNFYDKYLENNIVEEIIWVVLNR